MHDFSVAGENDNATGNAPRRSNVVIPFIVVDYVVYMQFYPTHRNRNRQCLQHSYVVEN